MVDNARLYWSIINASAAKHQEIIEATRYGARQKILTMNIVNYINSQSWTDLMKMMKQTQALTTGGDKGRDL